MFFSAYKRNLCAYCVGSSGAEGTIDEHLSIEWKHVYIPVCRLCRASGALPLARSRTRNGVATERRTQRTRLVSSDAHQDSTSTGDLTHVPGAASGAIAPLPTSITPSDVSVRRRRTPRSCQARSTRRG